MRIGEILGLTWDCVHIDDELVQQDDAFHTVEKELRRCDKLSLERLSARGNNEVLFTFPNWKQTGSRTILVLKTPKTDSSVRDIYIPNAVVDALEREKKRQEELKYDLGKEYQDFNLVIAQPNGRPVEERFIAKAFADFVRENNLRKVVFHSLRHSSTSVKLKLSGGDIKAVQGDTGHAQSNMVTDVYSHIMNDDRKRLAKKMDTDFFSTKETAAQDASNDSATYLMRLIQDSPELAEHLLQMTKLLQKSS